MNEQDKSASADAGDRFESTGDQRVSNNTMRQTYRTLTDDEKAQVDRIKGLGEEFLQALASIGNSRELSLAKTKMEEGVFWAVKHITA